MDKMAEAMMQVPSQAALDNNMSKTPKPSEVVTDETGKDKVGKGKTRAAGVKESVPAGAVNKEVLLILREINNNFNKQSEKVAAQNQRIEHLASKVDSICDGFDPDDFYFEDSENQVDVEPLESEPPLKKQRTDDGSVFKSLSGWLVGFVALRPKSTAMVIAGRSVHLTTLFPGQA